MPELVLPDELEEEELDELLELLEELDELDELLEAGSTNKVMLCEGTVVVIALFATARSARWEIEVCAAELICQAWAVPWGEKFARLNVTGVLPCCLLITITVNAASELRTAANADRLSGFATVAETLVSPNVDLLPS